MLEAVEPDVDVEAFLVSVERAWRPMERRFWILAGMLLVLAAVALVAAAGSPVAGGELVTIALALPALAWGGWLRVRAIPLGVLLSAAESELSRGRFARAERIASQLERAPGGRRIARAIAGLKAELALARGDAFAATRAFQVAIAASDGAAHPAGPILASLRAGLAVAHALAGDDDAALAAAAAVRKTVELRAYGRGVVAPLGTVKALLGRAALAEVVVASRHADVPRLEVQLSAARATVLDATSPRERALFRALQRMSRARVPSVYRRAATPALVDDSATPIDWVAQVMPDAGPFAQGRAVVSASAPAFDARGATAASADAGSSGRGGSRERLLRGARVVALLVLAVSLYFALTALVGDPRRPGDPVHGIGLIALVVFAALGLVAVAVRRGVTSIAGANEAFSRAATTAPGVARAILEPLDTSRAAARIGVMKELALARLSRESGAFEAALAHGDEGLRLLARGASPIEPFHARVEVHAERALALAALGRAADARAALAETPIYFAQRPAVSARVELFVALPRGEGSARTLENARAIARSIGEHVPLDRRSELAVDLLRASGTIGGLGLAEDERIRAELDEPGARAFLEALSPALGELAREASE